MRFVIIGAGAVGVTLGAALESMKHEVAYLVRPGRGRDITRFILVNANTGKPHRRERPVVFEHGSKLPPHEWALLCMRGEQLEAGLETLRDHVRPNARVGLAAAHLRGLEMTRAAWKGGPVFEMLPLFAAWAEDKDLILLVPGAAGEDVALGGGQRRGGCGGGRAGRDAGRGGSTGARGGFFAEECGADAGAGDGAHRGVGAVRLGCGAAVTGWGGARVDGGGDGGGGGPGAR